MSTETRKTVLITGCSAGGIGDALARKFHSKGLRVIATAREFHAMDTLATLGIERLTLDVTHPENIQEVKVKVAELTGGKLDILVNNAGIPCPVPATDLTLDIIRAVYNVNVFGVMAMVQAFVPLLIASGDARIVHMGSLAGTMPVPFSSVYNSSKAALHSFGDTLRLELAPFNVKMITVVSGNVQSNIMTPRSWHGLPPSSLYQPIQAEFQRFRIDQFQDGAIPADEHARNIVAETLKRHPRAWLWSGRNAWLCWLMGTFGGRRAFDGLLSKMFGLAKLSALCVAGKGNDQ